MYLQGSIKEYRGEFAKYVDVFKIMRGDEDLPCKDCVEKIVANIEQKSAPTKPKLIDLLEDNTSTMKSPETAATPVVQQTSIFKSMNVKQHVSAVTPLVRDSQEGKPVQKAPMEERWSRIEDAFSNVAVNTKVVIKDNMFNFVESHLC